MKLKPCPFCGSEALAGMGNTETLVGCSKFQCAASARHVDVSGEQWNNRHHPPDITKAKLIIAIGALEEIAKKATFTEIRRMSSEALEKIK